MKKIMAIIALLFLHYFVFAQIQLPSYPDSLFPTYY